MIRINYKNVELDKSQLMIDSITPYNDGEGIKFTMKNSKPHNLMVGDEVVFTKYYYDGNMKMTVCADYVRVKTILGDEAFITYPISNFTCGVIRQSSAVDITRDITLDNYHAITPNDINKYINSEGKEFKLITDNGDEFVNVKNIDKYNKYYNFNETFEASEILYNAFRVTIPNETYVIDKKITLPFTRYFFIKKDNNSYILFDNVEITRNKLWYSLPLFLEANNDYVGLMQESNIMGEYVNSIKEELIPQSYNMERIKYKPLLLTGEFAEGLIFNLHFREREKVEDSEYVTTKEWYIPEGSNTYWNTIKSLNEINDSENPFISKSDLLGYLGFTVEDVAYQKAKIGKSFIRLSFYDSKDPITQNLLFYSTIFMDSGKLYGKYLKLIKMAKKANKDYTLFMESDDEEYRLSSQISVYDEYHTESSSEGYNLYLFEDDVPLKNRERDIYLKVEFNHAGFGRTIPMILWDKEKLKDGLTMDNYLDSLYIDVRIQYTDKGYTYVIPNVVNKNNFLTFNLFEPRLEKTKK